MKQSFEKFLPKNKLKEKVESWQFNTRKQEREKWLYPFDRLDSDDQGSTTNTIRELHGVSFIQDIIPKMIGDKKNGEKVRILDIGAGAAFFTDEIRKAFPKDVIVFSTGLSKKTARDYRKLKEKQGEEKLHPNDLKWRSVLELSDFEEFDLIIDTFGELSYTTEQPGTDLQEAKTKTIEYLVAIIKKLKPGGLASIILANPERIDSLKSELNDVLNGFEQKYNVEFFYSKKNACMLRIEKSKPLAFPPYIR